MLGNQYVLGPVTSLYLWRAYLWGQLGATVIGNSQPDLRRCVARVGEIRMIDVVRDLLEIQPDLPLDAIVGQARRLHRCKSLNVITLHGHLPFGSFRSLGGNVFICGPELCFALLARGGNFTHLLELGCELCGTYAIAPDGTGRFTSCPQRTTVERLRSYLAHLGHRHGVVRARQAAGWLADCSASPRETDLHLALALSCPLGGYDVPPTELNGRIDIPEQLGGHLGKGYLMADLVFADEDGRPIAVGEYDSDEYHFYSVDSFGAPLVDASKIIADDERREVLRACEVEVVTFRNRDLRTFEAFDHKVARLVAVAQRNASPSAGVLRDRRRRLYEELFDAGKWHAEHLQLREMAGYERNIRRRRAVAQAPSHDAA